MAGPFPFQLQFLLLPLSVQCLCNLWQKQFTWSGVLAPLPGRGTKILPASEWLGL